MLKFEEFFFNKQLEIMLESELTFSKQFLNTLKQINSPLSNKIMDLSKKDINTRYNYIDISKDNDTVTFIADAKAKEIIGDKEILYKVIQNNRYLTNSERNQHIYDRLGHERPERSDNVYQPGIGTVGKIISETIGSSGSVYCLFECTEGSYIGKRTILNKEALDNFDPNISKLWTTNRNPIKIGRLVRALLNSGKIAATDKEVEEFVNSYKASIDILNNAFSQFDIVSGDKIAHFYKIDNYYSSDGTLGGSCMAEVPEHYFQIYVKNPEVCRLVILYSNDGEIIDFENQKKFVSSKIKGRALLWKTREGDEFLDRVYTNNDNDIDLFHKFSDENGWWYKTRQSSRTDFMVKKGEHQKEPTYLVDLKVWNLDSFPYLDSLAYFNSDDGILSNNANIINADYLLNDTSGGYDYIGDENEDD